MNGTISERVVRKVAEASNTSSLELPPLYNAIDPDALNTVVEKMSNGKVSFTYAGHEVTVRSSGSISLDRHLTHFSVANMAQGDS